MIFYSIEMLVKAGIKEILVVTGGNNAGDFLRLLKNGKQFGLKKLDYAYQEGEKGIADALKLARDFVGSDKMVVALGDNIVEKNIKRFVTEFKKQKSGARILLTKVKNPKEYGVAELKGKKINRIVEKPRKPKSKLAVTGIYCYPNDVFEIIRKLKPSGRGELEITDVNNAYIKRGELKFNILNGWWIDCGESVDALLQANNFVRKNGANK